MTEAEQRRLDAHAVDRRPVPEAVPALDTSCCWHCHNSTCQMHVLECRSCGYVVKGPAVQDRATCSECGGKMECLRYTWRLVAPEEREGDASTFGKRCYHPPAEYDARGGPVWP